MTAARWRRRQFVLTGFQTKWLIDQLLFILVLGAGLAGAVVLPAALRVHSQDVSASTQFLWLHERFWPVLLAVVAVLTLHAVRSSHRVAGPLFRFRLAFEKLAEGNLTARVRIRADDYLQEEAAALDWALEALDARVSSLQTEVARLADLANRTELTTEAELDTLRQAIARATAAARRLNTSAETRSVDSSDTAVARSEPGPETGFSLIELLMVITLVGTLAAIGTPTYLAALEKARVTRAIGDIRSIELEIKVFQLTVGRLPVALTEIRSSVTQDPWGNSYEYTNLLDLKGKGKARKDRFLNPINSEFDLYSVGKDGKSSTPLTAKASRDDVVRANDGGFIGLASDY